MDFTGKVAIVTGGANGIGKEIVRGIVEGGGFVVIADINEAAANKTVEEFGPEHKLQVHGFRKSWIYRKKHEWNLAEHKSIFSELRWGY